MKFSLNTRWNLLGLVSLVVLTTGCLKNDISDQPNEPQALVLVGHLATHAPKTEMYLNDAKATNTVLNVNSLFSIYSPLRAASYKVSFKSETDSLLVEASSNYAFDSARVYTIFTYSDYDSTTKLSIIRDDFSAASNQHAIVRFLNTCPDDVMVDVYMGDTKVWAGRSLADHIEMPQLRLFEARNANTYDVKVTVANEPENVLARRNGQAIENGQAYTIWFTGYAEGTGIREHNVFLQRAAFPYY